MNKYEVIIYWSEEDQMFVAEVPELPGCAAHGPTQEAALTNAQEAIRLWLDTAPEFGDPIPVPKGRRLIFACPRDRLTTPCRRQARTAVFSVSASAPAAGDARSP